jgi:hypothetical protein
VRLAFPKVIDASSNDQEGRISKLSWSMTALHSGCLGDNGHPIKRVILDEVRRVKTRNKARHEAIKGIPAQGIVMLSGTLPHNRRHDMNGYVDCLKDHPFGITDAYGRPDNPGVTQLRRRQVFLQAILDARPQNILDPKHYRYVSFKFPLRQSCNNTTKHYFTLCKEHLIRETRQKESPGGQERTVTTDWGRFFSCFTLNSHRYIPCCLEDALAGRIEVEDEDRDDPDNDLVGGPKEKGFSIDKDDW